MEDSQYGAGNAAITTDLEDNRYIPPRKRSRSEGPPARRLSTSSEGSHVQRLSISANYGRSSSPQPSGRWTDYSPTVSSPLNPQLDPFLSDQSSVPSEAESEFSEERNLIHRRNLLIRVVDVPNTTPPISPIITTTSTSTSTTTSTTTTASDVKQKQVTSSLQRRQSRLFLQSTGWDFSRYPSRRPSGFSASTPTSHQSSYGLENYDFKSPIFPLEEADPERGFSPYVGLQGILEQYPSIGEKEEDDNLHNPDPDEVIYPRWKRPFKNLNRRGCLSFVCFIFLIVGVLCLFLITPILINTGHGIGEKRGELSETDEKLSSFKYPILRAIRASLIDPDTPDYAMSRDSVLGRGNLKLVFSDEFNVDGRSFYENDDQFWQAADLHYSATGDLEWYDPDAITTENGALRIRLDAFRNHDLDYRSGMLQSWNKLCFKGGVLEVSASLPGPAGVPGLWPGIWTLGNLARPGYESTSDGVWPYSYDQCDVGITPNQSSNVGISYLPGQKLAKCSCKGEDDPSPGVGRGAPEIDVLEATADNTLRVGVVTQSIQVAPFDIGYKANSDFITIKNYEITQMNGWSGGPFQQAISGVTKLNNDWYSGQKYQKYAFEYLPGKADGAIAWFVGDEETFRMTGNAVGPDGNVGQRDISREPMSIILNLGFSPAWTYIDWDSLR
ncbi:beta-glucan synthesis-associated protein [Rhizina undulata]